MRPGHQLTRLGDGAGILRDRPGISSEANVKFHLLQVEAESSLSQDEPHCRSGRGRAPAAARAQFSANGGENFVLADGSQAFGLATLRLAR